MTVDVFYILRKQWFCTNVSCIFIIESVSLVRTKCSGMLGVARFGWTPSSSSGGTLEEELGQMSCWSTWAEKVKQCEAYLRYLISVQLSLHKIAQHLTGFCGS